MAGPSATLDIHSFMGSSILLLHWYACDQLEGVCVLVLFV